MKKQTKKFFKLFLVMALILTSLPTFASAKVVQVFVDGDKVVFDEKPDVKESRVFVPLRGVFEKMNAKVSWNPPKEVDIETSEGDQITVTIGEKELYKNSEVIVSDVAPYIKGGRTLVPLRVISETMGCKVLWDSDNYAVLITTDGTTPVAPSGLKPEIDTTVVEGQPEVSTSSYKNAQGKTIAPKQLVDGTYDNYLKELNRLNSFTGKAKVSYSYARYSGSNVLEDYNYYGSTNFVNDTASKLMGEKTSAFTGSAVSKVDMTSFIKKAEKAKKFVKDNEALVASEMKSSFEKFSVISTTAGQVTYLKDDPSYTLNKNFMDGIIAIISPECVGKYSSIDSFTYSIRVELGPNFTSTNLSYEYNLTVNGQTRRYSFDIEYVFFA